MWGGKGPYTFHPKHAQVHYRHDDADALHPDEAQQSDAAAASSSSSPTTGADGSPRSWHAALALLERAKARGADVHVTLRHACDGGDGFVVGVLAAHALAHGACRKGLKHAVPSIQRALREARLHEARGGRGGQHGGVALAEVPNPAKPQPQVMAFAGWATVLGAWQARHVHRVWNGRDGWGNGWDGNGDGDEMEEEGGEDRSHKFVVFVGDRYAAESREFLAHAGGFLVDWLSIYALEVDSKAQV